MRSMVRIKKIRSGFSLAEVLTALIIGSMVLVAVLGIYGSIGGSRHSVARKVEGSGVSPENLSGICGDLYGVIGGVSDNRVSFLSKIEMHGYPSARLEILRTIYDDKNKKQILERIIWQSSYDYDSDTGGLVLYRSHSGIALEDKLLDESKENWERELFVPICNGVTFFKIQAPRGEDLMDNWGGDSLPKGIVVTVSFAEPIETQAGTFDVPDSEKIKRTIAIDRTRKIKFEIVRQEDMQEHD